MSEARFCRACGASLPAEARFCEQCGAPRPPESAPAETGAASGPPGDTQAAIAFPWYLRPSSWVALTLLVFLILGLGVMIRGRTAKPDTSALAGGNAPIGGEPSEPAGPTASPSNDPVRENLEAAGQLGQPPPADAATSAAEPAATPTPRAKPAAAPVPELLKPYLGRWRVTSGAGDLKEDERLLKFVAVDDLVKVDVPALSAKFIFTLDTSNGMLQGTFVNASGAVPASVEYDGANDCLNISIRPENSEPQYLTAVPAK